MPEPKIKKREYFFPLDCCDEDPQTFVFDSRVIIWDETNSQPIGTHTTIQRAEMMACKYFAQDEQPEIVVAYWAADPEGQQFVVCRAVLTR